jgi:hypothetical protein
VQEAIADNLLNEKFLTHLSLLMFLVLSGRVMLVEFNVETPSGRPQLWRMRTGINPNDPLA